MALDAAKNFAKATVSTGYTSGATTVVLASGHGAKLPAAPFNAVWYDSTLYTDPSDDPNVEVVRVTVVSTDTLTVTRAQESTSAANHNAGGSTYKLVAGPTAKLLTDILGISITGSSASCTGNAVTATTATMAAGANQLNPGRTINGVAFDGTANITVTADANTLSGTTLKSTVVTSSLTSVGTLAGLNVVETSRISRVTSGNNMDLEFYSPLGTPGLVALLRGDGDGVSNTYGALSFWTTQVPGTLVERMRINSLGNVGIGMTPAYTLDVNGTVNATEIRVGGVLNNGGLVQIAKITTSASQATVDFTSIPATFTDLEVRYQARSNLSGATENVLLKFNNDATATNYTITQYTLVVNATTTVGTVAASTSGLVACSISAGTALASTAGDGRVTINNYSGTTFYKHMLGTCAYASTSGASQELILSTSGFWKNTAAITRLTFISPTSFVNGSVFTLYGVGAQ
jgi:hypothetical protein